jgi:hypothetical protein
MRVAQETKWRGKGRIVFPLLPSALHACISCGRRFSNSLTYWEIWPFSRHKANGLPPDLVPLEIIGARRIGDRPQSGWLEDERAFRRREARNPQIE